MDRHTGRRFIRNYKAKFPPRQQEVPPEPPETIIASLLFQIGDQNEEESTECNIVNLVQAIESHIPQNRNVFLQMIIPIVFAQPVKTSLYGVLIGILNYNSPELGAEIVEKLAETLQQAFDSVNPYKIRLLLRLCIELIGAKVIKIESYVDLLARLLEQCDPMKNGRMVSQGTATASESSARSELFLSILLDILPFVGKTLFQLEREFLCNMLEALGNIFRARENNLSPPARKMLSVFNQGNNMSNDWAHEKWNQLCEALTPNGNQDWNNMEENDWNLFEDLIVRPDFNYFSQELQNGVPVTLKHINIPDHISGHAYERRLRSVFRIFDESKTDSALAPAGRIVVEQYIIDLFCALNSSHKVCMRSIFKLDFGANLEHLLVEILFGQILEVPFPPYKQIYYGDLIVDGYKTSREFAEALSEGVNIVFWRLHELDAECFDRFSEWFSFHLSSIDWKWEWEQWIDILDHPDSSHQRRFICEVIEQCIRLSYFERVSRILPESFSILVPQKPAPSFAYSESPIAKGILEKVYERVNGTLLEEYLDECEFQNEEEKLEMLLHVLLHRGCKSTTHILKLCERYLLLLQKLIVTTNQKIIVLNAVQSFWIHSPQNIIIIVDKLMTYCIVDNVSIEKWILSSKSGNQLRYGYIWIILRKTVEKTKARLNTIEQFIQQVERGEIKFEGPEGGETIKNQKLASLQQQKDQSAKELETLLLVSICDFCVLMESPVVAKDSFLLYRVRGHLMELIRKYASFIQKLMQNTDTRSQLLANASEETAMLLSSTSCL